MIDENRRASPLEPWTDCLICERGVSLLDAVENVSGQLYEDVYRTSSN
jgi:hypothetical protein